MRIQAKVIVHNYELLERRKKLGYTQLDLADMIDIPHQTYSQIETLKLKPTEDIARSLALELNCDVDTLFPEGYESIVDVFKTKRTAITEYSKNLLETTPTETILQLDTKRDVDNIMSTLTSKEAMIIGMSYGLPGYDYDQGPCSLEEIGSQFGITRERTRQIRERIEAKIRRRGLMSNDENVLTYHRLLTEFSKLPGFRYHETRESKGRSKLDKQDVLVFKAQDDDSLHIIKKLLVKYQFVFDVQYNVITVKSPVCMIISKNVATTIASEFTEPFRKKNPHYKHVVHGVLFNI